MATLESGCLSFFGDSIICKIHHYPPLLSHKGCCLVVLVVDGLQWVRSFLNRRGSVSGAPCSPSASTPRLVQHFASRCVRPSDNNHMATRLSARSRRGFGVDVSQIGSLAPSTIGILNTSLSSLIAVPWARIRLSLSTTVPASMERLSCRFYDDPTPPMLPLTDTASI